MIPNFPKFKKLEINDLYVIEEFTKQFPPYNDFDLVDLMVFNPGYNTTISMLNKNLILRRQHYTSANFLYTFLGTHKTKDTIEKLLQKTQEENLGSQLVHIPEISIKSPTLQKYFLIKEDTDNFDYILSINELAELKGKKYYDKRNLVNRFKKHSPDHIIKPLDLTQTQIQQEIITLFYLWEKQKGIPRHETITELEAIQKLFSLVNKLTIYGLGVYIQDRLIGFTTYHGLTKDFAAISFEKGDTTFPGIYSFLNHETAKHLKNLGFTYLNFEQDLGIPGLKKAKTIWRPIFFLKKYVVSRKD